MGALSKIFGTVAQRLDRKQRGLALTVGGMGVLLTGGKVSAVGMFARGISELEDEWRDAHPEFRGGLVER